MAVDLRRPAAPAWDSPHLDIYALACLLHRDATLAEVITHARGRLCYLATPYSRVALDEYGAWDPYASVDCAVPAAKWACLLALEGVTAVSPIIQAVEMVSYDYPAQQLDPLDGRFWEGWCRPLLAASDVIIIPPITGWAESEGIWHEACAALRSNRRVYLIRDGEEFGGDA